jgi:4,5-DOPA dioxygenase extradiol
MGPKEFAKRASSFPETERMPVVFVGHGSPMNLVEDNEWSRAWKAVGRRLPRPAAILVVSAHWFTDGTFVHAAERPKMIYDFYGFPPELYRMTYPCPGSPAGAREAARLVKSADVRLDAKWGIDHGAWLPLERMFPKADVPAFQMSVDYGKPGSFHYDLARELAPLRRRGVLVIASGNIVHNLGLFDPALGKRAFDWADAFDRECARRIMEGDHRGLVAYEKMGEAAMLSVPTPDHYFPMLSALGLQEKDETPEFFAEGTAFGSVSMRSFVLGL